MKDFSILEKSLLKHAWDRDDKQVCDFLSVHGEKMTDENVERRECLQGLHQKGLLEPVQWNDCGHVVSYQLTTIGYKTAKSL